MNGESFDLALAAAFALLMCTAALYARAVRQGGARWWRLAGLVAVAVLAGILRGEGWTRTVLFDLAAFVAVGLVWVEGTPEAIRAARRYLRMLIVSLICLTAGMLMLPRTAVPAYPWDRIVVGLFVVGFGVKLALVPFYFWLPDVAERAAPMTTVLVVSVVDIAAFTELARLRAASPWIFVSYQAIWLTVALLSMFGGALLALAQRNVKRMLAFSTTDDMGYLLLGVIVGPGVGMAGALVGALGHALFKMLLFGAVGVAEARIGRALTLDTRGLAARCPVSAAVFITGALGMIGIPPTFGFAGRWRLYLAGAQYGGIGLALVMAAATSLVVLYYARTIHRVWLGEASEADRPFEPKVAVVILAVLSVAAVALGIFPGAVTRLLL